MARLTDELDTGMQGKPVREPGYVPGGTSTALAAVAGGLDAFMNRKAEMDQQRKLAEAEQFKKTGRAAEFEAFMDPIEAQQDVDASVPTIRPGSDLTEQDRADLVASEGAPLQDQIFSQPNTGLPDEVVVLANQSAERMESVRAAVEQGTMPPISLNAAMSRQMLATINKYPEHVTAIMKIWKDRGIDDPTIRAVLDEQRQHVAVQNRNIKVQDELYEEGLSVLGGDAMGLTDEQIMAEGLKQRRTNHELDLLEQRTRIAQANSQISATERDQVKEDSIDEAMSLATQTIHNQSVGIKQALQMLMTGIAGLPEGEQQARFELLAPQLEQMRLGLVDQVVAEYSTRFPGIDQAKLRTNLEQQTKSLIEPFTGDIKTSSANLRALQAMETQLKIDASEAMPVFTALKTLGLDGPEIEQAMMGMSPDMLNALHREVKGFTGEFGQERASTRMVEIFSMLKGKGRPFSDMSPQQQKEALQISIGTLAGETTRFTRGQIADTTMLVNKAGIMVTAARGVGPTSTLKTLELATFVAAPEARNALIQIATNPNDPNSESAQATLMGSRGASALILESANAKFNRGEGTNKYWSARFDTRSGRWTSVFNEKAYAADVQARRAAMGRVPAGGGFGAPDRAAKPIDRSRPEALGKLIGIANVHLDNIVRLKDYDPSTPKGSDLELRNYYGIGTVPASMKNAGPGINRNANVDQLFDTVEEAFEYNPARISSVQSAPAQKWRREMAGTPVLQQTEAIASEYGIPTDVAVALIGFESSFNPQARGKPVESRGGDTAYGLGQLMSKEAKAVAKALGISSDRESWSTEEQLRAAFYLLKQKYEEAGTGDWRDAVSRYFSGANFAGNRRSDGNTDVPGYIAGIFGG